MAMHACQIGPTDTAPPCPGSPQWACIVTRGEHFEAGNLSAPFLLCYLSVWMVRLRSPFVWDLRPRELAAGCLRSRPAWIVFCFRCWVADGKNGGMERSGIECWAMAAMGCPCRTISILRRIVRATKVATWSHPSALFNIIGTKHNWDQSIIGTKHNWNQGR